MRILILPVLLLRSLLVTPFFFFHTLLCTVVVFLFSFHPSGRAPTDWYIRYAWARVILKLVGMDVEVRGKENWPPDQGVLVLFNHLSWMDIPLLMAVLPRVPRYGAKIELFSIPFFGRTMIRVGMLPIERANRNKTLQVYRDAAHRVQHGEVFALAPEGTRQTELVLGRFKQGPFLFAIGAKVPAVPVLIAGVREVMPKGSWLINPFRWKIKVIVQILPAVFTTNFTEERVTEMQQVVRDLMEPAYARLNSELGLA
jgi:1-acyl-sn-glycerol-3-phosphate acyltransferase